MLSIRGQGDLSKTSEWLTRMSKKPVDMSTLQALAKKGEAALASATPVDTGTTARSWSSQVKKTAKGYTISWSNSHVNQGVNIALILQTGHGGGRGGYVVGRDYINPALRPVFDEITRRAWSEVIK